MLGAGTNIPVVDTDAGEVAWVASSSYVVGDERAYLGGIYECVKDHSASTKPPNTDFVNWLFKSPTNRMAPFDEYIYTKARKENEITYVISPGFITGFAMYGLEADKFEFTYRSAPGVEPPLIHESGELREQALGLWEYLFGNLHLTDKWTSPELPMRPEAEITITIKKDAADQEVAVGLISIGRWKLISAPNTNVGGTTRGVELTPKSYSYFKRNDDGTYVREQGRTAKIVNGTAVFDSQSAPEIENMLTRVIITPVAVDFSDNPKYSHLSTFGFLSGTVVDSSPTTSLLNFKLEGNV